nr:transposase [arsenite-oxidising bacterium NT-25]
MIRCCGWFAAARLISMAISMSSVLMTLPSSAVKPTERSFCDLERRGPVTLLPDRALDTSRSWLAKHQSISIVARDRGGGYGEAIAKALPDAEQIADRWHLMENSSRAFLDAVGKSMRQIRQAVGSNVVDPKLLTYAEKLQYEGYLRRQETNEAIRELWKKGTSIRQIVRQTGHSRKLVRDVLRGQRLDVFRTRPSSLELATLAQRALGRRGAKRNGALAGNESKRLSATERCHRAMGSAPASYRKSQSDRSRQNAIGTG